MSSLKKTEADSRIFSARENVSESAFYKKTNCIGNIQNISILKKELD